MWLCISGTELAWMQVLNLHLVFLYFVLGLFVCFLFCFCLLVHRWGWTYFIHCTSCFVSSLGMALHDETVDGVKDEKLKQYKIHSLLYCQCFLKKINEYTRHTRLWWFKTIHGLLVLNCCVKLASRHRFTDGESIWHRNLQTIKYSFRLKILNVNRLKFLLLMLRQWIAVSDSHATC